MSLRLQPVLPEIAVAALTLGFGSLCVAFVWQPTLASFADDSVSYLVMGQVFSPWQHASPAVAEAFAREALYPPLFPAVLGFAGVAHDIALAHAVPALLLALCLPLTYALGVRWLGDKRPALMAVLVTAVLPSLWINAKGILSEPLYCLLLLATLCVLESDEGRRGRTASLSLLMAALALTRAAALVPLAAYGIWAFTRRGKSPGERVRAAAPAAFAALAYLAWIMLRPSSTPDDYARIIAEHARGLGGADVAAALLASVARQAGAIFEAWIGAFLIFWVEGHPLRLILATLLGLLALSGLLMRLREGKADAWIMTGYGATFLLWPFYDQMTRFLFPALPVLVLYAFVAIGAALRALGRPELAGHALLAFLCLSLAVPAMAFIRQRIAGGPDSAITEWYRWPDAREAHERARRHLDLSSDMEAIRRLTQPEDRVMWVAPAYIALLAGRRGIPAPPAELDAAAYREAVRRARPDYVFMSVYHPRDTLRTTAWRSAVRALLGHGEMVHVNTHGGGTAVSSVLLKPRLSRSREGET